MVNLHRYRGACLLLLMHGAVCLAAFSEASYTGSVELDTDFTAFYKTDASNFYLALQIRSAQDWFAFGIPEPTAGDMDGSDIVVVQRDAGTAQFTVTDRYALDKSTPSVDDCQDWTLVSSTVEGDTVTVELSRKLDTGSSQDRPIEPTGVMMVVWAYGSSSSDSIQYHSSDRGFASINFDPEQEVPSTWQIADLQVGNFSSTSERTIYACQTFAFRKDAQFHAVRFEVMEDPRRKTSPLELHHLIVYACNSGPGSYVNDFATPGVCNSVTGQSDSGCTFPMFTWAKGEQFYDLPANVGFRIGADTFDTFVVEVHYDNPDNLEGEVDSSTVRIYYTDTFREHDAGVLVVGDPFTLLSDIPAGEESAEKVAVCDSACTSYFSEPINVFASLLHMHAHGKQMWSTLQDESSGETNSYSRIDFYNYGIQKTNLVEFVLNPGDSIVTHCIFDTRAATEPVVFGTASNEEMCMDFLYYYPYTKSMTIASHCGAAPAELPGRTMCDLYDLTAQSSILSQDSTEIFGTAESVCDSSGSGAIIAELHPVLMLMVLVAITAIYSLS